MTQGHTMKSLFFALFAFAASPALAQSPSPIPPYVYPRTVTTAAALVLPANPQRRRVTFINPNATAKIAVCPVTSRVDGLAVTCTVGGAGSITLIPYAYVTIDGVPIEAPSAAIPSAWNAIADTPGSALTILEF